MIWLLNAPGLFFLALFMAGLGVAAHQRLMLPRRYRFLAISVPVLPGDYRCSERLRIISREIQNSKGRFGVDEIVLVYESNTVTALENPTQETLLQLNGIRLSLLRQVNRRGKWKQMSA